MAAAVDNESLEIDQEFNSSLMAVGNLFVMRSARDGVLSVAYATAEQNLPGSVWA
ncbi:MAG: hypothetical protein ACR65R_03955 [Methylomicrobium sp.]